MATNRPEPTPQEPKRWSPAGDLGIGLFMCVGSVVLFFYLADREATGEAFSMNAVAVLLYKIGGKWLVSGLVAAIGVAFLAVGVRRLMNAKR